jgi:hypothetical protein
MPAPRDYSGQKFNLVTIIENVGRVARCRCDCGQEFSTRTSSVTTGHTKSCGHMRAKPFGAIKVPLVGRTFGSRKVVAQSGSYSTVECVCGFRSKVKSSALVRGEAQSCGCARQRIIVGQTHGHWTVVEQAKSVCRARCACGTERWIRAGDMLAGKTKSCGCPGKVKINASLSAA